MQWCYSIENAAPPPLQGLVLLGIAIHNLMLNTVAGGILIPVCILTVHVKGGIIGFVWLQKSNRMVRVLGFSLVTHPQTNSPFRAPDGLW